MADKENSVRVTRLGKKRAAPELPEPATRKRVALGEIPTKSNIPATVDLGFETQPKRGRRKAKKKAVTCTNVDAESEDPHLCEPFESEMFEYLHNMEVSGFTLVLCSLVSLEMGMLSFGKLKNGIGLVSVASTFST